MIKKIMYFCISVAFFILGATLTTQAQSCVGCTSWGGQEPSCDTFSASDGYSSCTCYQGCDCVGSCSGGKTDEGFEQISIYNSNTNLDELNIPEKGTKIFIPGNKNFIEQENLTLAYLGSEKSEKIYIGKHFGAYKVSQNMFILYPLSETGSTFMVKNCSNKMLGIASLRPTPNNLIVHNFK